MIENDINIPKRQEDIIMALLTTKTKRQASRASGVSESTIYRLLRNPQFVEMLDTVKKQMYYNTVFNLVSLSHESINCLQDLIASPTSCDSVKYKASSFVINKILNSVSLERLERRVTRLEEINGIEKIE